ncbi:MAG: hypothetical protein IT198_12220 [Acidimicrobiia bacterium]|nr:hypothetical protein [Acidimicrobiia bacterium]
MNRQPCARPRRRIRSLLVLAFVVVAGGGPVSAQTSPDQGIGGGGDLYNQTVVIPAGSFLSPVHELVVHNSNTDRSIDVDIRYETAPGITLTPDITSFTLDPGMSRSVPFGIEVAPSVVPGDYPVVMTAVRADIERSVTQPEEGGKVVFVPTHQMDFTVQVAGTSASLVVQAQDEEVGTRVGGEFRLGRVNAGGGDEQVTEVATATGDELRTKVAPGTYEAAFYLQGAELAKERIELMPDDDKTVMLDVSAIAFTTVSALPEGDGKDFESVKLAGALRNHLAPIEQAKLDVEVYRDDKRIDTVTIEEWPELPTDLVNFSDQYRPVRGWESGRYEFRFVLVTPGYSVAAVDEPTLDIPSGFPWIVVWIGLAVIALIGLVVRYVNRRRDGQRPASGSHERPSSRMSKAA